MEIEKKRVYRLWGKASREGDESYHSLLCHMLDVAQVAQGLWETSFHGLLRKQVCSWIGQNEDSAGRWLSFWVGLHDIGKSSPDFQRKWAPGQAWLEGLGFSFPGHSAIALHGQISAKWLRDYWVGGGCFPTPSAMALASALGGHHGELVTSRNMQSVNSGSLGKEPWEKARQDILLELAALMGVDEASPPILPKDPPFYVFLAGLVSVSDWIGSNEDFFPFAGDVTDFRSYGDLARKRAGHALKGLGWTGFSSPVHLSFAELFPDTPDPRPLQAATCGLSIPGNEPAFLLIEAPMGEGKTEAAMERAASWSAAHGQQGCYFALPTQATSNQMYGRVHDFLARRFPGDPRLNLRLLHGRAGFVLNQEGFKSQSGSPEALLEGAGDAGSWFAPKKRGLLSPFGVGTVDQAMMAVLKTRHSFVRLFGLAGKTVVLDEIHAYDVYMSGILERLLAWLRVMGTSVVLLSATLPASKRRALTRAFTGMEPGEEFPYPRITWTENGALKSLHVPADEARKKTLRLLRIPANPEELAASLGKALAGGGTAAVVVNTVARAQECFRVLMASGLFAREELFLFHARFPLAARMERERSVLENFGRGPRRLPRAVLVATQVVEQSLDLDFDLLVSDLAPADLVLQRAGRLHRHDRDRPSGLAEPRLWLLEPQPGPDGVPDFGSSRYVYDLHVLLRSHLALDGREVLRIPEDLEEIVEEVYGEQRMKIPSLSFQKALEDAWADREQKERKEAHDAKCVEIPSPEDPNQTLPGFMSGFGADLRDSDDPELHPSLQAKTRQGPPSVKAICLHKVGEGLFLDAVGKVPVSLAAPFDWKMEEASVEAEVSISHPGIFHLLKGQEPPPAWKRSGMLRHHRKIEFEEGVATLGKYIIRLDPDLGLVIKKPE